MVKRGFDVAVSAVGLVLLTPLFLVVALLIKLESRGPVFYRSQRVGRGGEQFSLLKFRSMVHSSADVGPALTRAGDVRVTRVGHVLRLTKIDELPQLINVFRGEMSLVGPRPEDPRYVDGYTADQRHVLSVRPGITGPAAIQFRHEEQVLAAHAGDLERVYIQEVLPKKLELDLDYIERRTMSADIMLLIRTVLSILERPPRLQHSDESSSDS